MYVLFIFLLFFFFFFSSRRRHTRFSRDWSSDVCSSDLRSGAVSVVAPIIACEGAVAAALAITTGERLRASVLGLLSVAVAGVVLAAMGEGGGRAGALPAAVAAIIWGVILVLSSPVADDLGV